jgi:hypothetical protein
MSDQYRKNDMANQVAITEKIHGQLSGNYKDDDITSLVFFTDNMTLPFE